MLFIRLFILVLFAGITLAHNNNLIAQEDSSSNEEFEEFAPLDESELGSEKDSEFKELEEEEVASCQETCATPCTQETEAEDSLPWILSILGLTIIAGILVRFKSTRNLRPLFLLVSLFILGFYKTGCDVCPVNGMQNVALGIFGFAVHWVDMLWFIAIIPITYLLGRVYCGWICQLGALQEFLYLPAKFKFLQTRKSVKILRMVRIVLLAILLIQLAAMGLKYWCRIDPFISVFGFVDFAALISKTKLFDSELIIIITLVLLLLISSLLTHRPFCRAVCPVGLALGFISKLPGASVIGLKGQCTGCKNCFNACDIKAISKKGKENYLDNIECIACGKCIDHCKKSGLGFKRKSTKHPVLIHCKSDCSFEN